MLVDMFSHFSGAFNAVQGADSGAGGEVSNPSNEVHYDQGTLQKRYLLLKMFTEKLVNPLNPKTKFEFSFVVPIHFLQK